MPQLLDNDDLDDLLNILQRNKKMLEVQIQAILDCKCAKRELKETQARLDDLRSIHIDKLRSMAGKKDDFDLPGRGHWILNPVTGLMEEAP